MEVRKVRDYIESPATKFADSKSALAKNLAAAMKRALTTYDALPNVRAPIVEQATAEMRNEVWQREALNQAFGAKLVDVARIDRDVKVARRAHDASKPTIAPLDNSNLLAVMETITLAQRVAAKDPTERLSREERLAAIRSPALSGVSAEMAEFWRDEIIATEQPERLAAWREDADALAEAEHAVMEVKRALQRESGHLSAETGLPNPSWSAFANQHLAPLAEELAVEKEAEADSKRDAGVASQNTVTETNLAQKYRQEREELRSLLR